MTTRTERTVRAGDREIFVAEAGAGPAVVLLHGGGPGATGAANYQANIEALARRFRVVVPDLPGYGRSTKDIDRRDPFGSLADGVRGLLDALGLETAHLVGNSYGGAAALRLALDTPGRVGRLVLLGPGGIGTTRELPTAGLNRLLSYYTGDGPSRAKLEAFVRGYLVHNGRSVPDELIEQRYQASIDPEVVANPPLRRPAGVRALWRTDLTRDPRLRRLPTKTLVVWGTEDRVNRPSGGFRLATTLPDCTLLLVPRTGHWVQWEQAPLFNAAVTAFLTGEPA
ncbi:alpha/beta fold hydrolase [Amycolatopsis vancoresmycina]|uniref:2-hydroxy-6-oxo-6-phenylhexa-2,4-dienoate hydrolase n=1 Tax=Amycolatopsis vancoresmycina DSM 44592 TaxID=1292037 RepID=R1G4D0_9PSEU|nr:alpha/beta fold hydrolase [Amycolatopsis vancoresmycina]EOD66307.1 2-hydroxy-6-oxo-6-phenylhexa-2,4-dienoate hydrolase [Amycolatopsis vancoresmycina DSM 44592]